MVFGEEEFKWLGLNKDEVTFEQAAGQTTEEGERKWRYAIIMTF